MAKLLDLQIIENFSIDICLCGIYLFFALDSRILMTTITITGELSMNKEN